jgi:spore germination cell wall hydrolase CwlJ-like protein
MIRHLIVGVSLVILPTLKAVTADEIVAACLVKEADCEGERGMIAVMNVVVNRAHRNSGQFVSVVTKPKQFSCFNGFTPEQVVASAKKYRSWNIALAIVAKAKSGLLQDITGGATHYHASYVKPYWAKSLRFTVRIGSHLFYKEK